MTPHRDWQNAAACRHHPDVAFFPPVHDGNGRPAGPAWDPKPALAVCAGCPVLTQCRAWAEHIGDIVDGVALHGVIGACSPAKMGRPTTMMCGTRAAYERHLRRGEVPCVPCRAALAADVMANYKRQRLRRLRGVG